MPSTELKASQATGIYQYKNLTVKVQKCCVNIYFKRQCIKQGVIPNYANVKVPNISRASKTTQKPHLIITKKKVMLDVYIILILCTLTAHRDVTHHFQILFLYLEY